MSETVFKNEILKLSESTEWEIAKTEWILDSIFIADKDDLGTCLCGHNPIKEICVVKNKENNIITIVGNICVTKFFDVDEGINIIFSNIQKISKTKYKSVNRKSLNFLKDLGVINNKEYAVYNNLINKKKLSDEEYDKRAEINKTILSYFSKLNVEISNGNLQNYEGIKQKDKLNKEADALFIKNISDFNSASIYKPNNAIKFN